jgi:hypothetical protein
MMNGLDKEAASKYASNKKQVEFSKNLFLTWDDDGSGVLEADEIIKPLVGMGLSTDANFARKLLIALDPKATKKGAPPPDLDNLSINLADFIKIFKSDKTSEHVTKILKKAAIDRKHEQIE